MKEKRLAGTMGDADPRQVAEVREALEILQEISEMLNTGLDPETLSICVRLLQTGTHPEALADVVQEIKRSTEEIKKNVNNEQATKRTSE